MSRSPTPYERARVLQRDGKIGFTTDMSFHPDPLFDAEVYAHSKERAIDKAHEYVDKINAYPKLIEALRTIEMESREGGHWGHADHNEFAKSILRELGETE